MSTEETEQTEEVQVEATESPEEMLSRLMPEGKREELIERLNKLKSTLNQVETRMEEAASADNVDVQSEEAVPKFKFSPRERLELLSLIGHDLIRNMNSISELGSGESRRDSIEKSLKILDKISTIYEDIVEEI